MTLLYLILFIAATVAFNQLVRWCMDSESQLLGAITTNYVIAGGLSVLWALSRWPAAEVDMGTALLLGMVNGILYPSHLLIIVAGYRLAGVGIASAVVSCGIIVPVVFAWLFWGEPMNLATGTALALVPLAIWFMRPADSDTKPRTLRGDMVLAACFIGAGMIFTIHKAAEVYCAPSTQPIYQSALFVLGAAISVLYVSWKKVPLNRQAWRKGSCVGLPNALAVIFLLLALEAIAAVSFYPISSCSIILVNVALSTVLWKEYPQGWQWLGIALALTVIVLVTTSGAA